MLYVRIELIRLEPLQCGAMTAAPGYLVPWLALSERTFWSERGQLSRSRASHRARVVLSQRTDDVTSTMAVKVSVDRRGRAGAGRSGATRQ